MPTPAESAARALADLVPRLARFIARTLENDPELSLTLRQYRMLERLADRPHRTSELATTSAVTQATASASVASLEARGLVTRVPDPDDGRATSIMLTDVGRQTYDAAHGRVMERLLMVADGIDEQGAAALQRLLPLLMEGVDRARRDASHAANGSGA